MVTDYDSREKFCGLIYTLKVNEDNILVRAALREPENGRVLVVDGGGSLQTLLNGCFGCIRDSAIVSILGFDVKALSINTRKSVKRDVGERDIATEFANLRFLLGDYIYADEDGVLLANKKLFQVIFVNINCPFALSCLCARQGT